MPVRLSSRDACSWIAGAGYVWLLAFGAYLVAEEIQSSAALAALLVTAVLVAVVVAGYLVAERIWRGAKVELWLPAVAPALAVIAGIGVVVAGRPFSGLALAVPAAVVVAALVAFDAPAWRALFGLSASRTATTPAPAPAPAAPRQVRLTPAERAARLSAQVFALDGTQLETMIEAWEGLDRHARSAAWDAARPYLTALDRKELLTELREELKRWAAGEAHGEGAPSQQIATGLRHRANRALLDAAAGVIVQDRISKHDFDVLYAPFRCAVTGEPLHISRRPARSAEARAGDAAAAGHTARSRKKPAVDDGAHEAAGETVDEAGSAARPEASPAGPETAGPASPEAAAAGRR